MSFFKRIKRILTPATPEQPEPGVLALAVGDICEISLVSYQITGRTLNASRQAAVYTLQDGTATRYLAVEDREKAVYILYESIDGRLDSVDEVPRILELDDREYHLEEQFSGTITTTGKTPYRQGGQQHIWQYQSDDKRRVRIEWLDGRFMLYEGEAVPAGDVKVLRGK